MPSMGWVPNIYEAQEVDAVVVDILNSDSGVSLSFGGPFYCLGFGVER